MSLIIQNAIVIDGVGKRPLEGHSVWIDGSRIKAVARQSELGTPDGATVVDAAGKYLIPGLMNANVHLFCDVRLETLVRYEHRYVDVILEAAQVALRNGLTTVFDTWGPRRALMTARDRIRAGEVPGSRIYCAGNIIGFDGPMSPDFFQESAKVASPALVQRINAIWVENTGRHLMWKSPDEVGEQVRAYLAKGIDFIKYAANDHFPAGAGAFLAFSGEAQAAIVEAAHRAGRTAQAHSMSVEGLRLSLEAGCDLVTHSNITGPTLIPQCTLELFNRKQAGAVIFPWKASALDWIRRNVSDMEWTMWQASDQNIQNLMQCGAPLLLANDGFLLDADALSDPIWSKWTALKDENLNDLAQGHFAWLEAMEEKGCAPMDLLRAATGNIARAYGVGEEIGTIEAGKVADLLLLDANPLAAAKNYRRIHLIVKDGAYVERDRLPLHPLLTRPAPERLEEEDAYIPFASAGPRFPVCGCWMPGRHAV